MMQCSHTLGLCLQVAIRKILDTQTLTYSGHTFFVTNLLPWRPLRSLLFFGDCFSNGFCRIDDPPRCRITNGAQATAHLIHSTTSFGTAVAEVGQGSIAAFLGSDFGNASIN